MAVKKEDAHRKRVKRVCREIQHDLGLDWVTIVLRFHTDNEERVTCETSCDWEYRQASLKWNLAVVPSVKDSELYKTALHEFVHVILGPIHAELHEKKQGDRIEEFTTECITRALLAYRKNR